MPNELSFVSAFLVGLLGSTHCVGMCGGIVGALTVGLTDPVRSHRYSLISHLLAYNSGRILSYTTIGALAGLIGTGLIQLSPSSSLPLAPIISAAFMIALGLYLTNWWRVLTILERMGSVIWKRIEPFGRCCLPVKNPVQALGLGLVWGWLPCGMVYAVVAWSVTTGSAYEGASLMLGFGLGTLPMLLLMGTTAARAGRVFQHPAIRLIAGTTLIVFGLYSGISAFSNNTHQHHTNGPQNIPGTIVITQK